MYTLLRTHFVPADRADVWSFFSDPSNLAELMPPGMGLIMTGKKVREMQQGQVYRYIVRPLWGIRLHWVSRITEMEKEHFFVDDQVKGPFRSWRHVHLFREAKGGVEIIDDLKYEVPLGFIGKLLHPLFVKNKITEIFDYRYRKIEEIFGTK